MMDPDVNCDICFLRGELCFVPKGSSCSGPYHDEWILGTTKKLEGLDGLCEENAALKKRCKWLESIIPNIPKLCAHYINDGGECAINKKRSLCDVDCINGECKIGEWGLREMKDDQ